MCAQTAGQTLPSPRCRMATPLLRPLTVGEVLDVSFGLYRSLFAPLVVIAAVSQVIPVLLSVYMEAAGGPAEHLGLALGTYCLAIALGAFRGGGVGPAVLCIRFSLVVACAC